MNNIEKAFQKGTAFIGFLTAGDPSLDKTYEYILTMEKAGADIIEIGIPFSDPIAEGVVIQEADLRALKAHTTVDSVFTLVQRVRAVSHVPLVFLTYLNPVFHYGIEAFFAKCEEVGMDGIIIPDLPYEERGECAAAAKAHGISIISMIAPTSKDRIEKIASVGEGFLYIVSSLGVTGTRTEIKTDLKEILDVVKSVTTVPAAVGFGINTEEQARNIGAIADGVIVGSAIVKLIAAYGEDAAPHIFDYVKAMKEAAAYTE